MHPVLKSWIMPGSSKYSPDSLLKLAQGHAVHPDVLILPEMAPPDRDLLQRLTADLNGELVRLKGLWQSSRESVAERLCHPALKASMYGESRVMAWIAEMDRYLSDRPSYRLCDGFDRFTAGRIASAVKKDQEPPEHPVFEICTAIMDLAGRLKTELDRTLLFLKTELLRKMQTELPERKQKRNVLSFDDLLLRLRQALLKPEGEALASVIRKKYRAALIDEFQDTDPVQYAIFAKIFRAEGCILFLIGDPKQAIYSFRGADIFAYLSAASQVDHVYTLDANWRSDPVLIKAVNTLFSQREHPFVFENIAFRQATPGSTASREPLLIDGRLEPPLQWWFVAAGRFAHGDKPLAKGIARPLIAGSVAAEIARLLRLGREGRAKLGEKPLQEGDIAILVRTNREAQLCREKLSELRIPAVLHSTGNLFDSQEALEVYRVLTAILSPDREELLRAAMATAMIGCDLAALEALQRDEQTWEAWRERFRSYHERWHKDGFLSMFRSFLNHEQVRPRLLAYPDGERRLTNLLHLSEVLDREAGARRFGMGALLKWLAERRASSSPRDEEHQLRLESDSLAVRIVTIHKSKGLEYPIVFCPFSWGDFSENDACLSYHDPESHTQICDLGVRCDCRAQGVRPEGESGRGSPPAVCGPDPGEGPLHLCLRKDERGGEVGAGLPLPRRRPRRGRRCRVGGPVPGAFRWRDVPRTGGDRRKSGWRHCPLRAADRCGAGCNGNRGCAGGASLPRILRRHRPFLAGRQLFLSHIRTDP